jgi:hypothetical protein
MKVIKKIEVASYILELDKEEAQFLSDLCRRIGGDPTRSRRRIADRLRKVLGSAGVEAHNGIADMSINNSIIFVDTED